MANFKLKNPDYIVKALKKAKSQYKLLTSHNTEKFERIQGSCVNVVMKSTEFNAGNLKLSVIQ
jgi:hypothetical protein